MAVIGTPGSLSLCRVIGRLFGRNLKMALDNPLDQEKHSGSDPDYGKRFTLLFGQEVFSTSLGIQRLSQYVMSRISV